MSTMSQPLQTAARWLLATIFYVALAAALLLALAVFPGAASASENRKVSQAPLKTLKPGTLQVCLYPGFQPFVGLDGNGAWTGWDVRFLQEFALQQGLQLAPVRINTFNDIWVQPTRGVCDIAASGISDLEARRRQTDGKGWSDHYYSVCRAFGVRTADQGRVTGVEDFKGKTVIVTGGSTADLDLANRLVQAGIARCSNGRATSSCVDVQTTNSEEAAAQKVQAGQAFAYGGGLGSIQYLACQQGSGLAPVWQHCNMLSGTRQTREPFSFVVRPASTGLLAALNTYIANPAKPYGGKPSCQTCPPAGSIPPCPSSGTKKGGNQ